MGYFANGIEGAMFEEAWCARCIHSDIRPGREIGVDPPCPVWFAHQLFAYELGGPESAEDPGKQILDLLISHEMVEAPDGFRVPRNECKMFAPIDAGAAIPGQQTLETGA